MFVGFYEVEVEIIHQGKRTLSTIELWDLGFFLGGLWVCF